MELSVSGFIALETDNFNDFSIDDYESVDGNYAFESALKGNQPEGHSEDSNDFRDQEDKTEKAHQLHVIILEMELTLMMKI